MQGSSYLVAAYVIVWLGLFAYLAFLAMRIRAVQTELVAVEELVREFQEKKDGQNGN